MTSPLITVLMPVYNAERFLSEAMDSVLNQTFTDFEFLIIDDGSTDNSLNIVKAYDDQRIRLLKNEKNMGISGTLNKGIELAAADLIARMDADDISYPDRLTKQYNYLKNHPDCVLLSTQARVITEDNKTEYIDRVNNDYLYYNLTFFCVVYHPTVMYCKQAVREVGMYTQPYTEDFELFWQLSRKYKIYNLPEVLLDYRTNSESLHQVTKKKEYDEAGYNQALRNIRFYAGSNYMIPESYIRCYQFDYDPLLKQKSAWKVVHCIRQLNYISRCIIKTENINRDINNIKKAALYKRELIISFYAKNFSPRNSILLLARMGKFGMLAKYLKALLKI